MKFVRARRSPAGQRARRALTIAERSSGSRCCRSWSSGSATFIDITPSGLKPGSTDSSRAKLCSKQAGAGEQRDGKRHFGNDDRALGAVRRWPRSRAAGAGAQRVGEIAGCPTCIAGRTPKTMPVTSATAAVNASVVPSIDAVLTSGSDCGARAQQLVMPDFATRDADRRADQREQHALGDQLAHEPRRGRRRARCESPSRFRAPSRARAAGSRRWRTAISSTSATAPSMMNSGFRMSPTM